MKSPEQTPPPGQRLRCFRGDGVTFRLRLAADAEGTAMLRTNLGRAAVSRQEIIGHVESGQPVLARDWHDIPMPRVDGHTFELCVPLLQVGLFHAKAFFLPTGSRQPVWPAGDNTAVKIEPAHTCAGNRIYTAFVRQFGPNQYHGSHQPREETAATELEDQGFTVIPRSGTFRDLIGELDFIIGSLGSRIIQLLPIHPVPTTYARMGRYGSPFAALDLYEVDPALAVFDHRTTPMDQFEELVTEVHRRDGQLFLDMPINHTGWASALQLHHPEWFVRLPDDRFQSPGAWGVTWEDLSQLDYGQRDLWAYMAEVFIFWCKKGVDGFRCDAGYMVPCPVWQYITARVREAFPDTVFLLEGLGGPPEATQRLLTEGGMNWGYSELFQVFDRRHLEAYLPACQRQSAEQGTLVHFAETHDNLRLAARSAAWSDLRTALTALCSDCGSFGFANGVEWYAPEHIDVHGASSLNWGGEPNAAPHLGRLQTLLNIHPSFLGHTPIELIHTGVGEVLAACRRRANPDECLLVVANLQDDTPAVVTWEPDAMPTDRDGRLHNLLGARPRAPVVGGARLELAPGEVCCLSPDAGWRDTLDRAENSPRTAPVAVTRQRLRAAVLDVAAHYLGQVGAGQVPVDDLIASFQTDPVAFCTDLASRRVAAPKTATAAQAYPAVTTWRWPVDLCRQVMVPPRHLLLIRSPMPFHADLEDNQTIMRTQSLPLHDGTHAALITPGDVPATAHDASLSLTVFDPQQGRREVAPLTMLAPCASSSVARSASRGYAAEHGLYAICTNGRGAMAQVRSDWGAIDSLYDALLAANLDAAVPVDRTVLLTRCRGWVVHRGYSRPLNSDCLEAFGQAEDGTVVWRFAVPVGLGCRIDLTIRLTMQAGRNAVALSFYRAAGTGKESELADTEPVDVIVRPDIEDRVNHATTKAHNGPEAEWPGLLDCDDRGFRFRPSSGHHLAVVATGGTFTREPEWQYKVPHPVEATRGLDDESDLFSPGYFTLPLSPDTPIGLNTTVIDAAKPPSARASRAAPPAPPVTVLPPTDPQPILDAMRRALHAFVVKRDAHQTVIAGYPWFLDWGRDALICLRGLIAAGESAIARDILVQFAVFERHGTLPNMIRGNDDSNRDTSDAPLWLIVAAGAYLTTTADTTILEAQADGRTFREVLISIATHYRSGTPNQIKMDAASGLVFSPSHFTWMDTKHPTGTPREGYPIEIQSLWSRALGIIADLTGDADWRALADQVAGAILKYYWDPGRGYLSDCLHGSPGTAAAVAVPDDALRPNQLLAITLGAIQDPGIGSSVLRAGEQLLVPGAIRSLADQQVQHPIPIRWQRRLLNDPRAPYWGTYTGDEDTRRKPAYHNGTAWTWLFPSFCEALVLIHGESAREAALDLLGSAAAVINRGCLGQVPEVLDGDLPHTARGCGAQAWGVAELVRVLHLLSRSKGER